MTTTREAALEALSESTYNHPMSLVMWQSWIDDLPLPDDFDEAKNALQEYLQQLAFPTALSTPPTAQGYVERLEAVLEIVADGHSKDYTDNCILARNALAARPAPQPAPHCEYCDGTGDVHRADGEWLGNCYACNFHRAPQPAADTRVVASLLDPNAVHLNMLRGTIAMPSVSQIKHIYGDALTPAPSNKIAEAARVLLDATPNPVFDMLKPVLMGEFSQSMGGTDEDGNEVTHKIAISWTVTKEIIAAALRALAGKGE